MNAEEEGQVPPGRFAGKTVLVTGGSSGLGHRAVERCVAVGATTYVVGRNPVAVYATAARLGPRAVPVQADVTRPADLDRLYATVKERSGRLDVVVANAGSAIFGTVEDVDEATLDHAGALSGKGIVFTVQKALPLMPDASAIVLMSSIEGGRGTENLGVYAALKAAAQSFARTWAKELAPRRIRVNAISPGVVFTPAFELAGLKESDMDPVIPLIPAGRLGLPSEVGAAIAFLASDDASFVNGTNLVVDGGQTEVV